MHDNKNIEVNIDLKKMLVYCFSKWKGIVVVAIIIGIAGVFALSVYEARANGTPVERKLTETELEQVEIYADCEAQFDRVEEYLVNSILIELDSNEIVQYTLHARMDEPLESAANAEMIMANVSEKVAIETVYLQEVMEVECLDNQMIEIRILSDTSEKGQAYYTKIQGGIADSGLQVTDTECRTAEIRTDIFETQNEYWSMYYSVNTYKATLYSKLNDTQKAYLSPVSETVSADETHFNMKYLLIFTCVGGLLATAGHCAIYILSDTIHATEDFEQMLRVHSLGYVSNLDADMRYIYKEIELLLQEREEQSICLVYDKAETKKISDRICEELAGKYKVNVACEFTQYEEELEKVVESKNVVFIKTIHESKIVQMNREIQACDMYDLRVLGAILCRQNL